MCNVTISIDRSIETVMITRDTLFIVGAGASFEVGFPLASGLKNDVKSILSYSDQDGFRDRYIGQTVRQLSLNDAWARQRYVEAANRICVGLDHCSSIDTFLDMHRDNQELVALGKLAITIAILRAEHSSVLTERFGLGDRTGFGEWRFSTGSTDKYRQSWFRPLGELLTQGVALGEVDQIFRNITFVTFNYDRCIEVFAEALVREAYGLAGQAADIASTLEVMHVYGQVGDIRGPNSSQQVGFGHVEDVDFLEISRSIKTFTESIDSEMSERIRSRIASAETLVFLGFGWLPQNLGLLGCSKIAAERVFYTSHGIQEPDRASVTEDINQTFLKISDPKLEYRPEYWELFEERGTCADLFSNHWRQLTRR